MKYTKWLLLTVSILVLSACSSVATEPSVELPYTIVDEENLQTEEIFEDELNVEEEYVEDIQILYSATVRELTDDEAKRFVERNAGETTNILKEQYQVVEFDFNDVSLLHRSENSFNFFPKSETNFVYDEMVIPEFNQILDHSNKTSLTGTEYNVLTAEDDNIIYTSLYEDMKILALVRNEYAEEGLQLRTKINDEQVYIDIQDE